MSVAIPFYFDITNDIQQATAAYHIDNVVDGCNYKYIVLQQLLSPLHDLM
jgi:hypothetical protein